MLTVLLVIQIIIAIAMIVVILLQRSSSDGLSGLGGGGGGNALMTGRASANMLTKTTAILATVFMVNSLAMATITARSSGIADSVIKRIESDGIQVPAADLETGQTAPAEGNVEEKAVETAPAVPKAE